MMFLKQKMDAAQGFIDAVRQRQNTLMVTIRRLSTCNVLFSWKEMNRY